MPERVLIVNQYGLETVNGTAVAADTRLVCEVTLPDSDRTVVTPEAGIGKRVPGLANSAFVQRVGAEGVQLTTPSPAGAYYQILPLLFSSLIKGNITPAEQNPAEGDYLWSFTDPLTGVETLDTFTLETGDGTTANDAYEVAYCIVRSMEIAGNAETGEVTITATIDGDQITQTTLTTVATMPTFTGIPGKLALLYVDGTWANLGTTELAASLLDFTISIEGGGHLKRRGGASLKPNAHGQSKIMITGTFGLERSSTVETERANYFTTTPGLRCVRLIIDSGVQIGAGDNHIWQIDIAGNWTGWNPMGREQDGNNIDVATITCGYDPTGTHAFNIDVTTDVSAI